MALKFINAGGSLTLSAALFAALWAIRTIRAAKQHRASTNSHDGPNGHRSVPKYLCKLSSAAVALLVKLQPIPHHIIDVRAADKAASEPKPAWLGGVVNIPEAQLSAALRSRLVWARYADSSSSSIVNGNSADRSADPVAATAAAQAAVAVSCPSRHHLLVLVGSDDDQQLAAAARAAAAGYDRVAVLKGGFQGLLEQPAAAAAARGHSGANYPQQQQQQQLPFLHRDALALLLDQVPLPESAYAMCNSIINQRDHMQQQQQHIAAAAGEGLAAANGSSGSSQRLLVIDVRRHDERTLYGSIPGAVHIPVEELGSALEIAEPDDFRRRYHFDPPAASDVIVMQSRCDTRAQWAGQIAWDAGLTNVYVYEEGAYGWRFTPVVQAYTAYQQADPPPEPEPFTPSQPDVGTGVAELQQLGLLQLLLHQHSLH